MKGDGAEREIGRAWGAVKWHWFREPVESGEVRGSIEGWMDEAELSGAVEVVSFG